MRCGSKLWRKFIGGPAASRAKNELAQKCKKPSSGIHVRPTWTSVWMSAYTACVSARTSAGVVRGPVFAGHAHHLRALGLVSLLAAYFTARPHHVPVVLSSGRATAHVAVFHLNGRTPRCPYKRRKDSCTDLSFVASRQLSVF